MDTRRLISFFSFLSFNHTYREHNQLADRLSKKDQSLALGCGSFSEFIDGNFVMTDTFQLFWAWCGSFAPTFSSTFFMVFIVYLERAFSDLSFYTSCILDMYDCLVRSWNCETSCIKVFERPSVYMRDVLLLSPLLTQLLRLFLAACMNQHTLYVFARKCPTSWDVSQMSFDSSMNNKVRLFSSEKKAPVYDQ